MDSAEDVIQGIAIWVQSGRIHERADKFKFLRKFIVLYEKKLQRDIDEADKLGKVKKRRNEK